MRFLLPIFLIIPLLLSAQTVLVWLSGQGVVRVAHAGPAVQAVLAWEGEDSTHTQAAPFDLLPGEVSLPVHAFFSAHVGQGRGCWALYEAASRRELARTCAGGPSVNTRPPSIDWLLFQRGGVPLADKRSPFQGSDVNDEVIALKGRFSLAGGIAPRYVTGIHPNR